MAHRSGMYNIFEHGIVAHANRKTVAMSDGKQAPSGKAVASRDLNKYRCADQQKVNELFGEYDEGCSSMERSKGFAVPYSTNCINGYVPPRASERLKDRDGKVLLPRSEKTVALFLRLIQAYTLPNEQVVCPCTGTMNDAIAGLSINRYPIVYLMLFLYIVISMLVLSSVIRF